MEVDVRQVPADATYRLRRAVLRPNETIEQLRRPGDDDPPTGNYAAIERSAGDVIGTASVRPEPAPFDVPSVPRGGRTWRLRGMATREDLRGRGIGAQVLAAAISHVAARGGGLLWCNARIPAVPFYARAGFATEGEPWNDPVIGPHVVMWRIVEPGPHRARRTEEDAR